jgi:hypothetical protein
MESIACTFEPVFATTDLVERISSSRRVPSPKLSPQLIGVAIAKLELNIRHSLWISECIPTWAQGLCIEQSHLVVTYVEPLRIAPYLPAANYLVESGLDRSES